MPKTGNPTGVGCDEEGKYLQWGETGSKHYFDPHVPETFSKAKREVEREGANLRLTRRSTEGRYGGGCRKKR